MEKPHFRWHNLDAVFQVYFLSHIPITLLMDGAVLVPTEWYPASLQVLHRWYAKTYQDPFMNSETSPLWFRSMVACELAFQLPLFFLCSYGLFQRAAWVRRWAVVYSVHVMTTMVPLLTLFIAGQDADFPGGRRPDTVSALLLFYAPYFFIPLLLFYRMVWAYEPVDKVPTTKAARPLTTTTTAPAKANVGIGVKEE